MAKTIAVTDKGFTHDTCLNYGLWRISTHSLKVQGDSVNVNRCKQAKIGIYSHKGNRYIPTWVGVIIWDLERYWFRKKLGRAIKVAGSIYQDIELREKYSAIVPLLLGPNRMQNWNRVFASNELSLLRDMIAKDLKDTGHEALMAELKAAGYES